MLAARWERFERGRRWRLFLLVPGLVLAAVACAILDVAMGFHVPLATWYAPILIVSALLARSATRPAGRAGSSARRLRDWWLPRVAAAAGLLPAGAGGVGRPFRPGGGWIDLTGSAQPRKLVAGWPKHGATLHRDVWCRLSIESRRLRLGLRAVEERLVLPGGRVPPVARPRRRHRA